MPNFLRIGVHQKNVSGYTSKAWCIRRTGSQVYLKWGAVEVFGAGDGRKVSWTRFQEKTIRCGTVQRANAYAKLMYENKQIRQEIDLKQFVTTQFQ